MHTINTLILLLALSPLAAQDPKPALEHEVRVLNTGSGPKRQLRYKIPAGQQLAAKLVMHPKKMIRTTFGPSGGVEAKNNSLTPISLDLIVKAGSKTPSTEQPVSMAIDRLQVLAGKELGRAGRDHLWSALAPAMSVRLAGQLKELRGIDQLGAQITDAQRNAWETLNSLARFNTLSIPLPAEPVGEGAVWQTTDVTDDAGYGVEVGVKVEVSLVELTKVGAAVVITRHFDHQYETPAGEAPVLRRFRISMREEADIRFDRALPVSMRTDGRIRTVLAAKTAAGQGEIVNHIHLTRTFTSRPAPTRGRRR